MAFKNSMDMRKYMKNLNLFEMRDDLIIRVIKYCGSSETGASESLLQSLCGFSYETVASKAKFRENKCIDFIALIMLTTQDTHL
jgi:hypothetical protein